MWKNIHGIEQVFIIQDEICRRQTNYPNKAIVLQKLFRENNGTIEFRLGYYMIGVRPRMRDKWVWGQFATMIPIRDFSAIVEEARRRKWF